jgi:hypothetical protein
MLVRMYKHQDESRVSTVTHLLTEIISTSEMLLPNVPIIRVPTEAKTEHLTLIVLYPCVESSANRAARSSATHVLRLQCIEGRTSALLSCTKTHFKLRLCPSYVI